MVPLAMTIRFFACHFNSKHFLENGTTRSDDGHQAALLNYGNSWRLSRHFAYLGKFNFL